MRVISIDKRIARAILTLFASLFALYSGPSFSESQKNSFLKTLNQKQTKPEVHLKKSDEIAFFDVALDKAKLSELKRLPYEFDFSKYEIWAKLNKKQCRFEIIRRPIENRRRELMASGLFDIQEGHIIFGKHIWRTRGMADESYLHHESNLKIQKNGSPVGKMPYFHLFINKGEVALPPMFVEMVKEREKGNTGEINGSFSFYVDDWQEGVLEIKNC